MQTIEFWPLQFSYSLVATRKAGNTPLRAQSVQKPRSLATSEESDMAQTRSVYISANQNPIGNESHHLKILLCILIKSYIM